MLIQLDAPTAGFIASSTGRRALATTLGVALLALLTALGAQIAVPLGFTPVPMTLQTLFVLLAGGLLGPVAGASSQLLYLGLGIAGVPIFAAGAAGFPWLLGPTGGYLMAFPLAAALAGGIAGRQGGLVRLSLAMTIATTVIFLMGAGWLSVVTDLSGGALFAGAVQPFLAGAAAKAAIAVVVVRQVRKGARDKRLSEAE